MTRLYTNNFSTELDGGITDSQLTIDVLDASGLPSIGGGDTCKLTLQSGTHVEIVQATSVTSNTITVVREQEGTTGYAFPDGSTVELRATAASYIDPEGEIDFGDADSLEIPNSATPTINADGEIAVDTTVADFSHGILKYYSGEELAVIAVPLAVLTSPTDGYVLSYNATNDEFELVNRLANVVEDTTPQLGGDLDLNGNNIDFPTTANISDCLDDDTFGTASATTLATSESIKAYVDTEIGSLASDDLTDITVTTPAAGEVLIYDASNGYFENATLTDGQNITITEGDGSITVAVNNIEDGADVTDEDNVTDALDGATLVAATVATDDKVLIQDTNDSDVLKTATAQSVADLKVTELSEDSSPQLAGDLDLNSHAIDFPTTANISDCIDDDTMGTASDTTLATSESIKQYVDDEIAAVETNSLVDVTVTTPAAGELLIYNGTATEFQNATLTDGQNINITEGDASITIAVTNIEDGADVTDETNVKAALDGATISSATVATDDKVLIQDTNDSDNLKTVTAQSIADLAEDTGDEWGDAVDADIIPDTTNTYDLGSDTYKFKDGYFAGDVSVGDAIDCATISATTSAAFGTASWVQLPFDAAPSLPASTAVMAYDTTVSDYADGLIRFKAATGTEMGLVMMPAANFTTNDGYVLAYNATDDDFELVEQSLGSDGLDDLSDVTLAGEAAGNVLIYNSSSGQWVNNGLTQSTGITITPSDGAITFTTNDGQINHDNLQNFSANEHIDWTGANDAFLTSGTITGSSGAVDFNAAASLKIPQSAAPTITADGHIAVDTTVTDFSAGVLKYYGGEEMGTVAMPIAEFSSPTDGYIVQYNATNDEFELADVNVVTINDNLIIGGDFNTNPWQRDFTSFSSVANNDYTADRWVYNKSGAMVHDIIKASDSPTAEESNVFSDTCLHLDCTTADASIAAGDYCHIGQILEGYTFAVIAQQPFTLSFWVKSTKTGTFCVSFSNSGQDRSYVAEYTINDSDTWEFKTITVSASPAAGTWNYLNSRGLRVYFALACGSTYQTTAGSWQTGNYKGTSNQVNACDNTANDFKLNLVKLERGSVATQFLKRSNIEELGLCQRYYYKSYKQNVDPGATSELSCVSCTTTGNATEGNLQVNFPFTMRATPTITWYSPDTGDSGKVYNVTDDTEVTVSTTNNAGNTNSGYPTFSGAETAGDLIIAHLTAASEM